jgi:uncharacterized protein (TIGR02246 family)
MLTSQLVCKRPHPDKAIKKMISMKKFFFFIILNIACSFFLFGQNSEPTDQQRRAITVLIDQYSEAREKRDTVLLKKILTHHVDQLVSTGEWRIGIGTAVEGMLKSSANSPGTRTLQVDKIRMLNPTTAIVDCKYEIQNTDSTMRRMWSTFVVVVEENVWKISAIRNMLPASQ